MTIVFFTRLFYPYIGGVEKHVFEVGKLLIKKGNKIIVLTERYEKNLKALEKFKDIDIYRINVGKDNFFKKFRVWLELWRLRQLIKSADIIHAHDVFFWYAPFRFLYPKKPIFITFHGYETKFPLSKRALFVRKLSESLSNGSICVGKYIKKWYKTNSNYITYGGISLHNYHATVRSSYVKIIKILFIGRLEKDTGIPIYLSALGDLKKRGVRFTFEACGSGSLKKKIERFGRVYDFISNLAPYIDSADFVFSSSYLSILEAMEAKKLVFSVYDNLLKEDYLKMAPFARWMVIENSSEKLASKIEYFMNHHEEKKKIIDDGYQWVSKQTWYKVVELYLKLWHSTRY